MADSSGREQVYVAMAFVDGPTLHGWLAGSGKLIGVKGVEVACKDDSGVLALVVSSEYGDIVEEVSQRTRAAMQG